MKYKYSFNINIEEYDLKKNDLRDLVRDKLRLKGKLIDFILVKKSLDARKKPRLFFNLQFLIEIEEKDAKRLLLKGIIAKEKEAEKKDIIRGDKILESPPIIVGSGPAGLFCAYKLAKEGLKPIVVERGASIEERIEEVNKFIREGIFNSTSNIVFGEGGAGTFSDAKLTSRSKNTLVEEVLETFVKFGGDEEILYLKKPHLGTDGIRKIIKNMREEIISLGGEFLFKTKFLDFMEDNDGIKVITDKGECSGGLLVLAIGHSSKDTLRSLIGGGLKAKSKGFSIGFRIEHEVGLINSNQYGRNDELVKRLLGNSEYKLTYKGDRGVYSFCMCPGGFVVPSNSNKNEIVTNGMSYKLRDGMLSNSAIVASVNERDFGSDPIDALDYQRNIEEKAYILAGSNGSAIGQNAIDFIEGVESKEYKVTFKPTYKPRIKLGNFWDLLPSKVCESLREGLIDFDKKIPGFIEKGFLTGPETRTSSPVQFFRDEFNKVFGYNNVYVIGEGAGFTGGIVSSGIDGIKTGNNILKEYRRKD